MRLDSYSYNSPAPNFIEGWLGGSRVLTCQQTDGRSGFNRQSAWTWTCQKLNPCLTPCLPPPPKKIQTVNIVQLNNSSFLWGWWHATYRLIFLAERGIVLANTGRCTFKCAGHVAQMAEIRNAYGAYVPDYMAPHFARLARTFKDLPTMMQLLRYLQRNVW
jgi:hypothetical protein